MAETSKETLVVEHVKATAEKGNAESVLNAIDDFCRKQHWMMNVGDDKGLILDQAVKRANPQVALEMGCYCGYSAVRIARLLPSGGRLISLELNDEYAQNARKIIEWAGFSDRVTVDVGAAKDTIPTLLQRHNIPHVDLVFVDHDKTQYLQDLLLLEQHKILRVGSIVVGDNIVYPGAPDYLKHVQTSPRYKTEYHETHLEYMPEKPDAVTISEFLGYL